MPTISEPINVAELPTNLELLQDYIITLAYIKNGVIEARDTHIANLLSRCSWLEKRMNWYKDRLGAAERENIIRAAVCEGLHLPRYHAPAPPPPPPPPPQPRSPASALMDELGIFTPGGAGFSSDEEEGEGEGEGAVSPPYTPAPLSPKSQESAFMEELGLYSPTYPAFSSEEEGEEEGEGAASPPHTPAPRTPASVKVEEEEEEDFGTLTFPSVISVKEEEWGAIEEMMGRRRSRVSRARTSRSRTSGTSSRVSKKGWGARRSGKGGGRDRGRRWSEGERYDWCWEGGVGGLGGSGWVCPV